MSTSGLFLETERPHAIGDIIHFSIALSDSIVSCQGQVVRIEPLGNKFGIALELTSYDFDVPIKRPRSNHQKVKAEK